MMHTIFLQYNLKTVKRLLNQENSPTNESINFLASFHFVQDDRSSALVKRLYIFRMKREIQ